MFYGLLTISLSALLFELSLVKIFSVIIFSNYAFMIISTALFGFGMSGVICAVFPDLKSKLSNSGSLTLLAAMFGISVVLSFLVINNIPLYLAQINKFSQMLNLCVYYLALMTPFFFAGTIIVLIFSMKADSISKLYYFDLTGAALGCLMIIPLFKNFGGPGAFFIIMGLGFFAAMIFNDFKNKFVTFILMSVLILIALFLPVFGRMPLKVHDFKRTYKYDQESGNIEYSKWSALSKIDIALTPSKGWKRLWIDGGTNESALIEFDGQYGKYQVNTLDNLLITVPYLIKKNPSVAIIGSSGGREVLIALNHNPSSLDAIEMDPSICEIVNGPYSDYMGNIFHDNRLTLICDEGRSYIKRSLKKYDIIHQVNNFTPIAMASGAINVSETYLLTIDAFEDYFNHLTKDGYLVFNRHNTFKIAILAETFLKDKKCDPEKHIIVIEGEDRLNHGFYMKKSPFDIKEIEAFKRLAKERNLSVLYSPDLNDSNNWYVRLLKHNEGKGFLKLKGMNLKVPTDNQPFFEHIEGFGKIDVSDPNIPSGLKWIHDLKKFGNRISVGDLTFMVLFIEASLLSVIFIFLPLLIYKKENFNIRNSIGFLVYFFSIGFAFIIIELCLIQKFVLFLGVPIYSISSVIFALLFFSGIGSFITKNMSPLDLTKRILIISLILFFVLNLNVLFLSKILNNFLGLRFVFRLIITVLLICPLGIIMGMFFPLGIKVVNNNSPKLIPWVWGINSYATVIGSILGVFIAIYAGFSFVLFLAASVYITGAFYLYLKCESFNR